MFGRLTAHPGDSDAAARAAAAWQQAGQWRKTQQALEYQQTLEPVQPPAFHLRRAEAAFMACDCVTVLQVLAVPASHGPYATPGAHFQRGVCLLRRGDATAGAAELARIHKRGDRVSRQALEDSVGLETLQAAMAQEPALRAWYHTLPTGPPARPVMTPPCDAPLEDLPFRPAGPGMEGGTPQPSSPAPP